MARLPSPREDHSPARRLLLELAKERRVSLRQLAELCGVNVSYFSQFLNKNNPRVLPEDVREKIARFFNVDPDAFREQKFGSRGPATSQNSPDTRIIHQRLPALAMGDRDLPIKSRRVPGSEFMRLEQAPQSFVARPASLIGVTDAFAVQMTDDSMLERFRPNEILVLDPRLAPSAGMDVLIAFKNDTGIVRRLISQDAKVMRVLALGAGATQEVELELVAAVYVVCYAYIHPY